MKYDVIIIGAGIIGLSVVYHLLLERPDIKLAVIEKERDIASHQTGRNSGVIHSGIYYKPGSLKAINCKKGYDLLLQFCQKENIHYEICGKIIVATNQKEEDKLKEIYDRGIQNGLTGLQILNAEEIKEKEPHVVGIKGIFVPQAGIVDYKQVARKLYQKSCERGAIFSVDTEVTDIRKSDKGFFVETNKGTFQSGFIVNCAGLYSDKIAQMEGFDLDYKIIPFRGEYYLLKKEKSSLVKNLIYPVPDSDFPFLGVHFTRRINGMIDAGPNAVLAFKREGYKKSDIDFLEFFESITYPGFLKIAMKYWKVGIYEMRRSFSKVSFVKSLQKLVPEVEEKDLVVGGSGVRAQLCSKDGSLVDDFLIKTTDRSIHVINAPSPAATSSLNIGKEITSKILHSL